VTQSPGRLFLLYHELRPTRSDYSYALQTVEFEKQLDFFLKLRGGTSTLWPEITFDDGHISNFEYALPSLRSRNINAHFFITAGWTGKKPGYMGWQELQALTEAGQVIGAHGWSHTLLTHCNATELHHELTDARHTLEDHLGISITTMSLPGGRFNRRILDSCYEAGYTQVFTSIPKAEQDDTARTIGRLNIRGNMTLDWMAKLFQPKEKLLSSLERQYHRKAAAKALLGDSLYERLWSILNKKEPENEAGEARQT
jgi:peptidoglycan/xylan/chitin deacetylase (PgdA/CDA1 family)